MSIWKEIRKALNSSIGTPNFKPLDKLFTEHLGLGATDATLKVLKIEETRIPTAFVNIGQFVPTVNGNVRIFLEAKTNIPSANAADLLIEIIGSDGSSKSQYFNSNTSEANVYKEYRLDFNIIKNVSYSVQIKSTQPTGYIYIKNVKICGSVTDPTLIE